MGLCSIWYELTEITDVKSDIQTLMDNQQRLLQLLNETSTYHLGTMVRKVVRNTSVLHGSLGGVQVKTTHTGTVVRERCEGNDTGQWRNRKFDPSPRPNPLTDRHQKLHT